MTEESRYYPDSFNYDHVNASKYFFTYYHLTLLNFQNYSLS